MGGTMPLDQILPANLFAALLIFCRLGSAMMLLPGFGEVYVPQRYRLLLALVMAGLLTPVLAPILPALPASPARLGIMVLGEITVGIFIGTLARMMVSALETAGMMVSLQMGLSAATMFNPLADQNGSPLPAALYGMLGVVLIFLTDLDHLMLRAAVDSYGLFRPGALPPLGDFAGTVVRFAAGSFRLAFEMAAPFIMHRPGVLRGLRRHRAPRAAASGTVHRAAAADFGRARAVLRRARLRHALVPRRVRAAVGLSRRGVRRGAGFRRRPKNRRPVATKDAARAR